MWVMSRREGDKIHIGDKVTVTILRVAGNCVTLGVETPQAYRILKGECREPEGGAMYEDRLTADENVTSDNS